MLHTEVRTRVWLCGLNCTSFAVGANAPPQGLGLPLAERCSDSCRPGRPGRRGAVQLGRSRLPPRRRLGCLNEAAALRRRRPI
jgi:hypothetical protein